MLYIQLLINTVSMYLFNSDKYFEITVKMTLKHATYLFRLSSAQFVQKNVSCCSANFSSVSQFIFIHVACSQH